MKQVFKVEGMTCGHCEKAITRALMLKDPAAIVHIDRLTKSVEVESAVQPKTLAQVIQEEGYTVDTSNL